MQEQRLPLAPVEQSPRTLDLLKLSQHGDIPPPAILHVPDNVSFIFTSPAIQPVLPSGLALRILLCSWTI